MLKPTPTLALLAASCLVVVGCSKVVRGAWDLVGLEPGSGLNFTSNSIVASSNSHDGVEGTGPIEVRLRREKPDDQIVSVDFETVVESNSGVPAATPGSDFRVVRGTLTWGPNDGSVKTVTVEILRDKFFEPPEAFFVRFSNPIGASSTVENVPCRILDDSVSRSFAANVDEISASRGGAQKLQLRAGEEHAGRRYLVAGSFSDAGGFRLGGVHVPLAVDPWFLVTLQFGNSTVLRGFGGRLGAQGRAYAEIRTGPIPFPSAVGVVFYHAFVVYDTPDVFHMASNTVSLRITR